MPARCMKSISASSEFTAAPGIVSAELWRASGEAAKIRRAWRVLESRTCSSLAADMPLIELVPPSTLPRGQCNDRLPVPSSASV